MVLAFLNAFFRIRSFDWDFGFRPALISAISKVYVYLKIIVYDRKQ